MRFLGWRSAVPLGMGFCREIPTRLRSLRAAKNWNRRCTQMNADVSRGPSCRGCGRDDACGSCVGGAVPLGMGFCLKFCSAVPQADLPQG